MNPPPSNSPLPESEHADAGASLPRLEVAAAVDPSLGSNDRYLARTLRSAIPGADREIDIYLPAAYLTEPERRFPVFYLHDGQNLFDCETAYVPGHTWRAHSTADTLTASGVIEPVILVGIANAGERRMEEYTPTRDLQLGGGQGRQYGTLLLQELKPLIDRALRTDPSPAATALGGSSLGGLISLFLALEHREVFGKVAVISPSVWWDHRSILEFVRVADPQPTLRIWLDMGTAEGVRHLRDTDQLYSLLLERGWLCGRDIVYQRVAGAVHNEDAWAARFGDILSFLFPAPSAPFASRSHVGLQPCGDPL